MYGYILPYTGIYCFHNCTNAYIPVCTRIYAYRPFCYLLNFCMHAKKVQTGLKPAIFCILLAEVTPLLPRFRPEHLDISSAGMYAYIHGPCNTAGLCTWCLVTDQLCLTTASPAAQQPPAMTSPALAWTWIVQKPRCASLQDWEATMCLQTEARLPVTVRKRQWLDSWPVWVHLTQTNLNQNSSKKAEETQLDTCLEAECQPSHLSHHRDGKIFIPFHWNGW